MAPPGPREAGVVVTARLLFAELVSYLADRGWHRDGDDPGIWIRRGDAYASGLPFGEAVQAQLEADGVRMTEAP